MKKNYFLKILIIIVVVLVSIKIVTVVANTYYCNQIINKYMEAQGLKNEDKLSDTGTQTQWINHWFSREVVFKKNPNYRFTYRKLGVNLRNIFREQKNPNEDAYQGVFFNRIYLQSRGGYPEKQVCLFKH